MRERDVERRRGEREIEIVCLVGESVRGREEPRTARGRKGPECEGRKEM